MDEVGAAVMAISLVLIAVFVPTAFIPGISGQFYLQFAITISVATAISAFNSLTLSPALAGVLFKPHHNGHHVDNPDCPFWPDAGRRLQSWLRRDGEWLCRLVAVPRRTWTALVAMLVVFAGLLGATYYMLQTVPRGFIPTHGPGLCDRRRATAGRRLARPHRCRGQAGLEDHQETPGVAECRGLCRLQRRDLHQRLQCGRHLRARSTLSSTGWSRPARQRHHRQALRHACRASRRPSSSPSRRRRSAASAIPAASRCSFRTATAPICGAILALAYEIAGKPTRRPA